jgi:hypothetical protein
MMYNEQQTVKVESQFLSNKQIEEILSVLTRDVINPEIESKIKTIKASDEYVTTLQKVKDAIVEVNKYKDILGELKYNEETKTQTLLNNKYNLNLYTINSNIKEDLRARLLVTIPTDYDSIITNIKTYIDVDKYLYKKIDIIEEDED